MAKELVPDFNFKDPAAWTFAGFGASVTGNQLRFVNPNVFSSGTVPSMVSEIGRVYYYKVKVERYPASALKARILFGGVEIYDRDGAGNFSGDVVPVNNSGLIFQATHGGQWFLDSVSIKENMSMSDHQEFVDLAIELIDENGRGMEIDRLGNTPLDPNTPWDKSTVVEVDNTVVSVAVFLPAEGSGFGFLGVDQDLLKETEQVCLMYPDSLGTDLATYHRIRDNAVNWKINWVRKLAPGDQTILYAFGVAR